MTTRVKEAIFEAFESKAFETGHMTAESLKQMFESYHSKVVLTIDDQLSKLHFRNLEDEAPLEHGKDNEYADGTID